MKFRIWDNKFKVFYYSEENVICFTNGKPSVLGPNCEKISSEDCVCDRYTGYKDTSEKDIYENDIVDGLCDFSDGISVVNDEVFEHLRMLLESRIIGNIHENEYPSNNEYPTS